MVVENKVEAGKIYECEGASLEEVRRKVNSLGHYIIDEITKNNLEATVIVDAASGRRWTGKEFIDKALNIAAALRDELHFEQGSVVCINYDHSDLACLLAIAIICAGGIVCCCFPKDPYAELLYIARRVEPKIMFCHQHNVKLAKQLETDLGYKVVAISMDGDAANMERFTHFEHLLAYDYKQSKSFGLLPVACRNLDQDICFINMSSGTTGRPKAIASSHMSNIAYYFQGKRRRHSTRRVVASTAALDYVSGRVNLLNALLIDRQIVTINGFEAKTLLESIERFKINELFMGAAAFYHLITHPEVDKHDLSSLTSVMPIGAKIIYHEEMKQFLRKHSNIGYVIMGYAATEFTSAFIRVLTPEQYMDEWNSGNCGKLYPGTKAKIVDPETGVLLGPNKQGILHIKSPTCFSGYYDLERARKEKMNTDVDSNANVSPIFYDESVFDEDGFYITGDLAYFNEYEQLCLIGRQKELMSCRGAKKVIPQELEEVIEEHPSVSEVCVLGISHKREPLLHCPRAFIVPKTSCYIDLKLTECQDPNVDRKILEFMGNNRLCKLKDESRKLLAQNIMDFVNERVGWEKQLTGGIIILDKIPKTKSSGKVDKNYLRSLNCDQVEIYGDRTE